VKGKVSRSLTRCCRPVGIGHQSVPTRGHCSSRRYDKSAVAFGRYRPVGGSLSSPCKVGHLAKCSAPALTPDWSVPGAHSQLVGTGRSVRRFQPTELAVIISGLSLLQISARLHTN